MNTLITPTARDKWTGIARWMAVACILVSLLVFARRLTSTFEAANTAPGVAVTSGFEEETFFALWRDIHDLPIYNDSTRLPYASAYFNWLFYKTYACVSEVISSRAGDASITTTSRLITAVAALAGWATLSLLLRRVLDGSIVIALGLSTFVWFGPLVGWWALTARPDVGALAFETAGIAFLLYYFRTRPFGAAVGTALFFYTAWAFKQTYVFGLVSVVLFLLIRRQWRTAVLLCVVSVILWGTTFVALGQAYRDAFQATAATNVFSFTYGLDNFTDFLKKTVPLLVLAGVVVVGSSRAKDSLCPSPLASDAKLLGILGAIVASAVAFVASCKIGAMSYYFFTTTVMLALATAGSMAQREANRIYAASFGLAASLQLAVLTGLVGEITLQKQLRQQAPLWAMWQPQAEPRFAHLNNFNLPWLNPNSPPLVLAFNYGLDRAAGRSFEQDGVGGLISAGFFKTLLLPSETKDTYDSGSLKRYSRGETIEGLTVFRLNPPGPAPERGY